MKLFFIITFILFILGFIFFGEPFDGGLGSFFFIMGLIYYAIFFGLIKLVFFLYMKIIKKRNDRQSE